MTHPATPATAGAETSGGLIDLTPELQELSDGTAQDVRGGLLLTAFSVGKLAFSGSSQKLTDGSSNTIMFSEA